MKTYGGREIYLHHSWCRHYWEVSGQLHTKAAFTPGVGASSTRWKEGYVGPQIRYERCGKEKHRFPLRGM